MSYCTLPSNTGTREKIKELARMEKRTTSGQLDFIVDEYYERKKETSTHLSGNPVPENYSNTSSEKNPAEKSYMALLREKE